MTDSSLAYQLSTFQQILATIISVTSVARISSINDNMSNVHNSVQFSPIDHSLVSLETNIHLVIFVRYKIN